MTDTEFWKAYDDFTDTTAKYPKDNELAYLALGLCDEIGELIEKQVKDADPEEIKAEVGDVLWYFTRMRKFIDPKGDLFSYLYTASVALKTDLDQDGQPHLEEVHSTLVISSAQIAGRAKKFLRDGVLKEEVVVENLIRILMALGSLGFYVKGLQLRSVAEANMAKLSDRKDRGVLQGDGDNR